jgi:hypothetical protein
LSLERRSSIIEGFAVFCSCFGWMKGWYLFWRRLERWIDSTSFLAFKTLVIYYEAKYIVGCIISNVWNAMWPLSAFGIILRIAIVRTSFEDEQEALADVKCCMTSSGPKIFTFWQKCSKRVHTVAWLKQIRNTTRGKLRLNKVKPYQNKDNFRFNLVLEEIM